MVNTLAAFFFFFFFFLFSYVWHTLIHIQQPAIAAMHGPHSVFDIGHCTVIHCDAGDMLLVDQ